jgi:heme O synthase-like polyprenyltransferase
MAGWVYVAGALLLGGAYFWTGVRLAAPRLPATAVQSKPRARQLLQASIAYLPLLFALMMLNAA